ncbi:MAG: mechanosensitive ion channel protein MscS, partial [Methanobacteriota archaeon]
DFTDSALKFSTLFFVKDARARDQVASDVREAILEEFAAAKIQIPFPQRVVHTRQEPSRE